MTTAMRLSSQEKKRRLGVTSLISYVGFCFEHVMMVSTSSLITCEYVD